MSRPKFDDEYWNDYEEERQSRRRKIKKGKHIRQAKRARDAYKSELIEEQGKEL